MPRIVHSRLAYDGYAKVSVLTLVDEAGEEHWREVVSYGDSACVLPYDPERRVALIVRLPRAPLWARGISDHLVGAPAGMIARGGSVRAATSRGGGAGGRERGRAWRASGGGGTSTPF